MEADRFKHNQKYYIIGIICLIIGLTLLAFSLYIFPYVVFNWHYSVPYIVPIFRNILQVNYNLTMSAAGWLIFLGLFFTAIIMVVIAEILSNKIDGEIHHIYIEEANSSQTESVDVGAEESSGLVFKIIMIIVLVFVASEFFQWALSTTPI
jgi:hypothetical protein